MRNKNDFTYCKTFLPFRVFRREGVKWRRVGVDRGRPEPSTVSLSRGIEAASPGRLMVLDWPAASRTADVFFGRKEG